MSAVSVQSSRPSRRIGAWTLQGIIAAAFLAAGAAKLAGVPFMVDLFAQIGLGQWFRVVTGVVEVVGADHGAAEPQRAERSQAWNQQRDGAGDFDHAGHDAEPLA